MPAYIGVSPYSSRGQGGYASIFIEGLFFCRIARKYDHFGNAKIENQATSPEGSEHLLIFVQFFSKMPISDVKNGGISGRLAQKSVLENDSFIVTRI